MAPAADEYYMGLAIAEARRGAGKTSPNPCVGAVIVNHGDVVGKGYHRRAGTPHAEINAIAAAGEKTVGGTIYVTLEPCNHTGRTPPCSKAIVAAGLKRVVVGMEDPNPHVAGGGSQWLASQGIAVSRGVLRQQCIALNRPFIKHCLTGLPWVIVKAGMSLDGRIAVASGQSKWITSHRARKMAHGLRAKTDAIVVGVGTVLADDPSLTARVAGGRDPLRVVLDRRLRTPPAARMLRQQSAAGTVIFCGEHYAADRRAALVKAGAQVVPVAEDGEHGVVLHQVLADLAGRGCTSVLVEGGSRVLLSFLAAGLADEAWFFIAPKLLGGDGLAVIGPTGFNRVDEAYQLYGMTSRRVGDNMLIRGLLHPQQLMEGK